MITRLKRALGRLQGEKDSYALDQLDLKLLEFVNYPKGFFVEAGANDGVRYSNSLQPRLANLRPRQTDIHPVITT